MRSYAWLFLFRFSGVSLFFSVEGSGREGEKDEGGMKV